MNYRGEEIWEIFNITCEQFRILLWDTFRLQHIWELGIIMMSWSDPVDM